MWVWFSSRIFPGCSSKFSLGFFVRIFPEIFSECSQSNSQKNIEKFFQWFPLEIFGIFFLEILSCLSFSYLSEDICYFSRNSSNNLSGKSSMECLRKKIIIVSLDKLKERSLLNIHEGILGWILQKNRVRIYRTILWRY